MLEELGYKVLEAEDGENALQMCETHSGTIDLIITDVVMPRMGGAAFAQKVGEISPAAKILFISGYPDNDIVRYGILHHHVNFLQKPFSTNALAHKVRELLAS